MAGNLGNDAQRQAFALRANDVSTSFLADIQKHTLQEYRNFSLSVQDGAIKLGTDEAKRNWSDPVKIDTALSDIKTAVVRAGQLQGESANETMAKLKIATSRAHIGIIDAALQNNKPTYANLYLQKYKDEMTADDILKVNGVITRDLDGRVAQEAVRVTSQVFASRFQPTDMDRLRGIVIGMESGGKDANPAFALGSAGALQGSQSATKALDAGKTPLQALSYGAQDATAEIVTEMIPMGRLLKDLKAGAPPRPAQECKRAKQLMTSPDIDMRSSQICRTISG